MSNITATNIRKVIAKNESVRVTDVASRLFTTNKQAVRRLMNKMVCKGLLTCEKFKYIGNADICVYRLKGHGSCFVSPGVNLSQS